MTAGQLWSFADLKRDAPTRFGFTAPCWGLLSLATAGEFTARYARIPRARTQFFGCLDALLLPSLSHCHAFCRYGGPVRLASALNAEHRLDTEALSRMAAAEGALGGHFLHAAAVTLSLRGGQTTLAVETERGSGPSMPLPPVAVGSENRPCASVPRNSHRRQQQHKQEEEVAAATPYNGVLLLPQSPPPAPTSAVRRVRLAAPLPWWASWAPEDEEAGEARPALVPEDGPR